MGSFSIGAWPWAKRFFSFLGAGGVLHAMWRAWRSPKLRLAVLPFTLICFHPLKLSEGNQLPWSLLPGWVTGGRNWTSVMLSRAGGEGEGDSSESRTASSLPWR